MRLLLNVGIKNSDFQKRITCISSTAGFYGQLAYRQRGSIGKNIWSAR